MRSRALAILLDHILLRRHRTQEIGHEIIPSAAHGYGAASNYMMRRRWDYFVTNLMGAIPPKEYTIR